MTTTIRCYACGEFFDKKLGECPECGAPMRPVNFGLESQRWRTNLNAQASHAVKHT